MHGFLGKLTRENLVKFKKCGVVITSIYDNGWIERISENIINSNEQENVCIYFISDNKTPKECFEKIKKAKKKGVLFWAPSMPEQKEYEQENGLNGFILENSDHRRNIGYLKAYKDEVDFVISMDDDNFPIDDNFFEQHRNMLTKKDHDVVTTSSKFFNNCSLLDDKTFIHPRGFPTSKKENETSFHKEKNLVIGINAGMWTIAPDVDAISWLVCNKNFNNVRSVKQVVLSKDTYCPVNSQNTALIRELIPAYYFIKMNYDIGGGLKFDRLGDIYSGYFMQKVAKKMELSVSFGMPLVTHERNNHDYLSDANAEWGCFRTIDAFTGWLSKINLSGSTVIDCYDDLADQLHEFASSENFNYVPSSTAGFYHQMAYDMKCWIKLFR